jgi:LacI family repressor for deo operon, udp, cdd, tsx, nupC, and nupG
MNENVTDQVVRACLGKQMDGLILETIPGYDAGLRAQLDSLKIPYLVVHPASMDGMEGVSYVTIDDHHGARTAVEYLIDLGHRSIGCLVGNLDYVQDEGRLNGYHEALVDAGIPLQEALVYRENPSDFSLGYSGALRLMANNTDMTAIFCHTDEVAMGAMSAIWQSGRKIPDDISIVGFDDIQYAAMVIPPLTTIHQPIEQIGKAAVKQLIKLIDDPSTGQLAEVLPISLVVRDTCRSLKK